MDINQVLREYDQMFGRNSMDEIDEFLTNKIGEALEERDYYSALTLMNEMLGFCRDTSRREKGLHYCELVETMFDRLHLKETLEYATSLINLANVYRAFGQFEKAMEAFRGTETVYREKLPAGEFHYASLYNNWSLLYQEMEDYENAARMLNRALAVVDTYADAVIPQASTRCNLAATLLQISRRAKTGEAAGSAYDEAMKYLRESLAIFEADGGRDFHYGAALSAMGDALCLKEQYEEAAEYYVRTLFEIEKHSGKTDAYLRVEENYRRACKKSREKLPKRKSPDFTLEGENRSEGEHIKRCREFYERYGAPMIHEHFPQYEERIAVGLAGEGSECFGFDDAISKDHDYEIGFCMWLTARDYEEIGVALNQAYEKLSEEYIQNDSYHKCLDSRRGAVPIGAFYERVLGVRLDEQQPSLTEQMWLSIPEDRLATATNGVVFRDDAGIFTSIREGLCEYYPDNVWMLRLAEKLHDFAQYGQSNYARMMARGDEVTASLCVAMGMKSAMEIAYLLSRVYAPYYKWMRKGLEQMPIWKGLTSVLDALAVLPRQKEAWTKEKSSYQYSPYRLNYEDKAVCLFEQLAIMIVEELNMQNLVSSNETFLDGYCQVLAERSEKEKR